jgi:hypothetical protein
MMQLDAVFFFEGITDRFRRIDRDGAVKHHLAFFLCRFDQFRGNLRRQKARLK